MKRRTTVSIVVALSIVLVSLLAADSPADAQIQVRAVADTGIVSLGPGQVLRVSGDGVDQDDAITFRFRRIGYRAVSGGSGVSKYVVVSNTISAPITVTGGEATSVVQGNAIGTDAVRIVVMSSRPNVRSNAAFIDAVTGETQVLTALLLP